MRAFDYQTPAQIECGHAYRRLAILKVASPLVSALIAATANRTLAEEELDAAVEHLARRADQIAGQLAVSHLERLDPERGERIRRQIAQDVAHILAREHVRTRRNPDAQVTDATLAHILDLAQRHFESLPGATEQPRFDRTLPRQTEIDLAWMRAIARLAESAWTRPGAWSVEALADADPDALVERSAVHLSAAVARSMSIVCGVTEAFAEEQAEMRTTVKLSLLGQLSRGYARILEVHTSREQCAQSLEQRLTGFVEALLRYAQQHFDPRPAQEVPVMASGQTMIAAQFSLAPADAVPSQRGIAAERTLSSPFGRIALRGVDGEQEPESTPVSERLGSDVSPLESGVALGAGHSSPLNPSQNPFRISV